jgi:CRP/FNR family transcriptional regulator, dissimilatory nitrate respiration regulator
MDLNYLLQSCKLFSDLDPHELDALQQISVRKEYRKGEIIFSEGETSRGFFLVVVGAVKIFRVNPDGRERVFHVVEAGDAFAEAAMFMDAYPATAEALAAGTAVILIEKNGFKQLLSRDPKLSFKIIGTLVRWLRQMRDALTDITLKEVPARFASYVLSLPAKPDQPIKINVSKTTVAQTIGTTKETFSRLLHRLADHRVLTYRGNQIRVLNRKRLEKIASGEEKI